MRTGVRISPAYFRLFVDDRFFWYLISGRKTYAMVVHTATLTLSTQGFTDIIDITGKVAHMVKASGIGEGLVTICCAGSTGAVTTIEFEPGAVADLKRAIERLVPEAESYAHDRAWGDGNGFAHVRAALMKPSLSIPVADGELALGTWQQLVFIDFDNRHRERRLVVQIMGTVTGR